VDLENVTCECLDWIKLAQDFVNTVMNPTVPSQILEHSSAEPSRTLAVSGQKRATLCPQ
jgi:hypothetical protein